MFGMGGSEIIVILIVALLFLGPDKLPEATKMLSKGIRDIKKQTRILTQSIEDDEHIGGALRDIKSALRGDELPAKPLKPLKKLEPKPELDAAGVPIGNVIAGAAVAEAALPPPTTEGDAEAPAEPAKPLVTLATVAGEADPDVQRDEDPAAADAELAAMIRPPTGSVAKGDADKSEPPSEHRKHG